MLEGFTSYFGNVITQCKSIIYGNAKVLYKITNWQGNAINRKCRCTISVYFANVQNTTFLNRYS